MKRTHAGFTIVELLIVVVVIAILAAISIVAYNGIQQRARDSQRRSDVSAIEKALEMYYVDNGEYPSTGPSCGITGFNGVATTADKDGCWATFIGHLAPYLNNQTLVDPKARPAVDGADVLNSTNYSITTYYCNRQTYMIYYNDERPRSNPSIEGSWGGCSSHSTTPPTSTRHVIVKSKV